MPPSLLSSTAPCCLLLAFTKAAAALPGLLPTAYYWTFLRYVPFALWGHCCVTHFCGSLTLTINLYFSHLIGDPTLKTFLGLPGLWILDLLGLVYHNPSQFPVITYKVYMAFLGPGCPIWAYSSVHKFKFHSMEWKLPCPDSPTLCQLTNNLAKL